MNFTLDAIQKSIEDQLRNSSWFLYPERDAGRSYLNTDLSHAVIGLNEEAGEVAGLLKKHVYRNKTRTDEQWIDELGDVLWYLTAVAVIKGFTLEDIWQHNVEKLEARREAGIKGNESWEG